MLRPQKRMTIKRNVAWKRDIFLRKKCRRSKNFHDYTYFLNIYLCTYIGGSVTYLVIGLDHLFRDSGFFKEKFLPLIIHIPKGLMMMSEEGWVGDPPLWWCRFPPSSSHIAPHNNVYVFLPMLSCPLLLLGILPVQLLLIVVFDKMSLSL